MTSLKWILICVCAFIYFPANCVDIISDQTLDQRNNTSGILTIPFHLVKKLMVVEAYVDGKKGNFIIDTGTSSMILNSQHFTGQDNSEFYAADFAGGAITSRKKTVQFNWSGNQTHKCTAVVTSLSVLEELMGMEIMGYIGYEILKNYEVVFDYLNRSVTLFELNKKGKRKYTDSKFANALDTISLKPNGSLPYMTVHLAGKKIKLGIDSGASLNLLKTKTTRKINHHFRVSGFEKTAGFSGKITLSQRGILEELVIDDLSWSPMKCVVSDMSELNRSIPVSLDGLLGFEFLKQKKVSINYQRNQMYVWEHEILPDQEGITAK